MNIIALLRSSIICFKIKSKYINYKKTRKYLMLPGEPDISSCLSILPIYLSIYKQGYEIIVFTSLRAYQSIFINFLLGVNKFYFFNPFYKKINAAKKNRFKLINFEKYTHASIKRAYKEVDHKKIKNYRSLFKKIDLYMKNIVNDFDSYKEIEKIYGVFFTDTMYNPQGPINDYIRIYKPEIKIFNYRQGNTPSSLIINYFAKDSRNPISPPFKFFDDLRKKYKRNEAEDLICKVRNEIKNYYYNSDWISCVGTSYYVKKNMEKNQMELSRKFLSRSKGALFIIFPHIYWDASSESGTDVFINYKKWFEETIKYILENTNSNIIVKEHPAILSKYLTDPDNFESEIKNYLKKYEIKYSERFRYIKPNTPLCSLDLIKLSDYVLTVRGTIGVEAALFGKQVIFAGTGRYDPFEFGVFAKDVQNYFEILKKASHKSLKVKNRDKFHAALYLEIILNIMSFKNKLTYVSYKNKNRFYKKVFLQKLDFKKIINNIEKLSNWLADPSDFFEE